MFRGDRLQIPASDDSTGQLTAERLSRVEYPLPDKRRRKMITFDNHCGQTSVAMKTYEEAGIVEHQNGSLPRQFKCSIKWSGNNVTTHLFVFLASGMHRVVFTSGEVNGWIAKAQIVVGKGGEIRKNHNKEEWLNWCNLKAVASVVPKVYGYTELVWMGVVVSFIFVDRIGFTFAKMISKLIEKQPNVSTLSIVSKGLEMIVKTQMQCVREGCAPHDWQVGNVGVEDQERGDVKMMKFLNWQGIKRTSTPDSYRQRMDKFVKQ
jgi:hypothetical protein